MNVELFSSEKTVWLIYHLSRRLLALLLRTKYLQTQEIVCEGCRRLSWVNSYFELCREEDFGCKRFWSINFYCNFCSGLSSVMRAQPTLFKLASIIRASCLPASDCSRAILHATSRALFNDSRVFWSVVFTLMGFLLRAVCRFNWVFQPTWGHRFFQ